MGFPLISEHGATKTLQKISAGLLVLAFAFVLMPRGLINTTVTLSGAFLILSGDWKRSISLILKNPLAILVFIFVAYCWLSTLYSIAPPDDSMPVANKYTWLAYMALLTPVFKQYLSQNKWRESAVIAFLVGALFLCVISILDHYAGTDYRMPFVNHGSEYIRFGPAFAIAAFFAITLAIKAKHPRKWLYLAAFLIISFAMLFSLKTRTGYLCYGIVCIVFIAQHATKKNIIPIIIVVIALLALAYSLSTPFRRGITTLTNSTSSFIQHENQNTSSGERVNMFRSGLILAADKPFIGYGMGAYGRAYKNQFSKPPYKEVPWGSGRIKNQTTFLHHVTDPHNEFILVLVQLGLVGLILLLLIIALCFKLGRRLNKPYQQISTAYVLIFFFSLFSQAMLYLDKRFFFVMMIGLLYFAGKDEEHAKIHSTTPM